ncbi:glycosyltransferase family 4 protein [Portibacter marinus]|uniref:glycosyltransferase family 4 protein n=1 Tax=Portibacter marinus TaxID=2898660 RepID=UPI001F31A1D6|nr:glycosyltransferase family 4 protein [Portibacter marinus]
MKPKKKYQIVICSSTFQTITHGPSKFVYNYFRSCHKSENFELTVITQDLDHPHKNVIKLNHEYGRYNGFLWEYLDNFKYYHAIQKLDFEPDLIIFKNAILGYWTALKLKTIPVIGFINDDEKLRAGRQFAFFSKQRFHMVKSRFLEKKAAHHLDLVISNSNHLKDYLVSEYGLKKAKLFTLYKGIDLNYFKFKERNAIRKKNPIKVLFIKSDAIRGGLVELCQAIKLLQEFTFEIHVVGNIHRRVRTLISNSFPGLKIHFLGPLTQESVLNLMYESHLFCVPALREALGVANIEALATGLPVISTSAGGIKEVLNNGQNGYMATPGDSVDLSEKIRKAIEDPELTKQQAIAGRKYVEEQFDQHEVFKKFTNVMIDVIESRKGHGI